MNKSETAKLLTLVAAFDRRTIGEADVEAWHSVLFDIDHDDAVLAVKGHYRASRKWMMPSDVVDGVTGLRRWRLRTIPMPPAPAELVDENGYRVYGDPEKQRAFDRWFNETREAIASGKYSPPEESQAIAAIAATTEPEPEPAANLNAWWNN